MPSYIYVYIDKQASGIALILARGRNNPKSNMTSHPQDEVQGLSLSDPEIFWKKQADHLNWHKHPSKTLVKTSKKLRGGITYDHWEWFPGSEMLTCYNCVDRHVEAGNGDSVAII